MDFEKEYKHLVGAIKKAYLYAQTDSTRSVLEHIYPQVAESDDERMAKAIMDALNSHSNSMNLLSARGYQMDDVKRWLKEKTEGSLSDINIGKFVNDYLVDHRSDILLNPYNGLIDFARSILKTKGEAEPPVEDHVSQ